VKDRLGIGYKVMSEINPRLVYASMSGFGEDGPYRMRPGFDQIAQGMGGLMSVTGAPGQGPMRAGIPIADLTTGHLTAQGILIALLEREVSGLGQWVQTNLLSSQIAMMDFQAARTLMEGEVPGQAGNDHPTNIPTGVFATSDGFINIATAGTPIYVRLCKAMGLEDAIDDPMFASAKARSANRHALNAKIEAITKTNTSLYWVEKLNKAEVPAGPIYKMDEVFADPQVKHLGMTATVEHKTLGPITIVGQPIKLGRTPAHIHSAIDELGADTDAVLSELGYAQEQISALRTQGVI
jgi:crotonobetainyl-CoA:carnitine CoA-transferase CaiB-like acyl-CoA transferase